MIGEALSNTLFAHYGKFYSSLILKKNTATPFKDSPTFPLLTDTLSRKNKHHALIHAPFPHPFYPYFIEAFSLYLAQDPIPKTLQNAELLHLRLDHLAAANLPQKTIKDDFHTFLSILDAREKYFLLILSHPNALLQTTAEKNLQKQIELLSHHPKCRLLLFIHEKEEIFQPFSEEIWDDIEADAATTQDDLAILKQKRLELEHFHHALIPEELIAYAYALTERYLSMQESFEKTLLLLDSSAAHVSAKTSLDLHPISTPLLTPTHLLNVLSGWTQIPATHLQLNQFNLSEFTETIQQKIFGQEAAMSLIGHALQEAYAGIKQAKGPFSCFLFAGAKGAGKKTTSIALAEYLFKQTNRLFFSAFIQPSFKKCTELPVKSALSSPYFPLSHVMKKTPHVMIVIENIEEASSSFLEDLLEILNTGYCRDLHGTPYCFKQAIFILTTTLGTSSLLTLTKSSEMTEEEPKLDLLQLGLNQQTENKPAPNSVYSQQELVEHLLTELMPRLPATLLRDLHIIPFLPHNKEAIEKIIRLKLKIIGKDLHTRYGIDLGYAPEVIRFLTREILKQDHHAIVTMDKTLKSLYFSIERVVTNQKDKQHTNQLFLQLNEMGQALRVEWLNVATMRHHAT